MCACRFIGGTFNEADRSAGIFRYASNQCTKRLQRLAEREQKYVRIACGIQPATKLIENPDVLTDVNEMHVWCQYYLGESFRMW
ncbi:MAG: hypothetical protein D6698_17365 [Gammaproteobacteria bacterium]|nr:MAG: hypothetical protein D6698_17365 [Gammaproteobacteria bacterium]